MKGSVIFNKQEKHLTTYKHMKPNIERKVYVTGLLRPTTQTKTENCRLKCHKQANTLRGLTRTVQP